MVDAHLVGPEGVTTKPIIADTTTTVFGPALRMCTAFCSWRNDHALVSHGRHEHAIVIGKTCSARAKRIGRESDFPGTTASGTTVSRITFLTAAGMVRVMRGAKLRSGSGGGATG